MIIHLKIAISILEILGDFIMRIGNVELNGKAPKLLTHVGVTYNISSPNIELQKALTAVKYGADIIADASLGLNCLITTKLLCSNINVPVTCLPGYVLATKNGDNELNPNLSKNEIIETTEELFSYGVKGITVHATLSQRHIEMLNNSSRVFPFTSRMGHYVRKYIELTGKENPFYIYFDDIVKLTKKYNASLSLGIALRSPTIANDGGFDNLIISEIEDTGSLVKHCMDNNVNVTVEAGGHISIDRIPEWFDFTKAKCYNAPLRVLTLASDRGMGHDNVTGAITATYLARQGVEVICIVTRAEHISQPTIDDIRESVIHYKIALASAIPDYEKEKSVAVARAVGGCHLPEVIRNVIDPEEAKKAYFERVKLNLNEIQIDDFKGCTMCGESCPLAGSTSSNLNPA